MRGNNIYSPFYLLDIDLINMAMALDVPLDWLFYNNFVVGSIFEEEKDTMRKATEILQRLCSKKYIKTRK